MTQAQDPGYVLYQLSEAISQAERFAEDPEGREALASMDRDWIELWRRFYALSFLISTAMKEDQEAA